MHHAVTALGLAVLLGCGARTALPGGPGDGGYGASQTSTGAGGSAAGTGGFPLHPRCAAADGVRLCGDGCPPLPAPECPGFGCTPAVDRTTGSPSSAGVCWADVPDDAERPCTACLDGQVCAYRSANELVCVPEDVCAALWDLGATDVCRYADKSAYDHELLREPSGPCPFEPTPAGISLCGGACGGCPHPDFVRCTGRSPSHPFGLCVSTNALNSPDGAAPCARAPDGTMLETCDEAQTGAFCAIFDDAPADEPVARAYGVCEVGCAPIAAVFPGGLSCYNDAGQKIAP